MCVCVCVAENTKCLQFVVPHGAIKLAAQNRRELSKLAKYATSRNISEIVEGIGSWKRKKTTQFVCSVWSSN